MHPFQSTIRDLVEFLNGADLFDSRSQIPLEMSDMRLVELLDTA